MQFKALKFFGPNCNFLVNTLDNNIHFLDITIDKHKTDLCNKPTHAGQYSGIDGSVFHGIIKFHRLNPFTIEQKKFVHQVKSLGFKANVTYKATCPGCYEDYVGKSDHNLVTRLN